jgi:hypothetical protein
VRPFGEGGEHAMIEFSEPAITVAEAAAPPSPEPLGGVAALERRLAWLNRRIDVLLTEAHVLNQEARILSRRVHHARGGRLQGQRACSLPAQGGGPDTPVRTFPSVRTGPSSGHAGAAGPRYPWRGSADDLGRWLCRWPGCERAATVGDYCWRHVEMVDREVAE